MKQDGPKAIKRLFGRTQRAAARESSQEPPISQTTVGLCFEYERGLTFGTDHLSDAGLEHILKGLEDRGLRASFFCPAKMCETAPDHLARIVEAGHELGVLGYTDESPRDLTDDAVKQLVYACRSAFARRGLEPIGFRSPRSHWDQRLCVELVRQRFRYSAEHDHAKRPYVLIPGSPPLVRIPVCTDDRGLRHSEKTVNLTVSKHHRYLRKAIARRHFVSVCFHPWLLAEEWNRMAHWEEWLETAVASGARIGALEDVLPDEYRHPRAATDSAP